MSRTHHSLTLRQIAALAHTSKSTVSRVLTNNPHVAQKTRLRVLDVIENHRFRPNIFALGLAGEKMGLVGVLATEINSAFFAEVLKGVNAVAARQESHVLTSFSRAEDDYRKLWSDLARSRRVDAILLIAPPISVLERPIGLNEPPLVLCGC